MNEVTVVFQGMILWWMGTDPAQVLVPDLTKMNVPHTATISAPLSAFAAGTCPPGFMLDTGTQCTLDLNSAGKSGGVQIALITDAPPAPQPTAPKRGVLPSRHRPRR